MKEKTKDMISYSYRYVFGILIFLCIFNTGITKVILPFVVGFFFVFGGIVGLVTNRNFYRYATLSTPEGSILWKVLNVFEIVLGVFGLIMYYILTRNI